MFSPQFSRISKSRYLSDGKSTLHNVGYKMAMKRTTKPIFGKSGKNSPSGSVGVGSRELGAGWKAVRLGHHVPTVGLTYTVLDHTVVDHAGGCQAS